MAVAERRATVVWNGQLTDGSGTLNLESSGVLREAPVTWASRTEQPNGKTSPEELLAAAHASCFAMAFAATLARQNTPPQRLSVAAVCALDRREGGGFRVATMTLEVHGAVPGLDQAGFAAAAQTAEQGCPISNALRGNVEVRVNATLE
ncbi:MAG TPA: OsmC family peroxiredoxin [Dehalococcoidia bacterium]|nr:OsmC family peroxiredoxin [Dehalococcoidia bacterium]